MEITAHQVLVQAYKKVETDWWDGRNGTTGTCLALALDHSEGEWGYNEGEKEAAGVLLELIGKPRSEGGTVQDIYNWNDAEGRTKEEVLAVIQQGIAKTATFNFEDFEVLEEV